VDEAPIISDEDDGGIESISGSYEPADNTHDVDEGPIMSAEDDENEFISKDDEDEAHTVSKDKDGRK
jgi:hypothetical protein